MLSPRALTLALARFSRIAAAIALAACARRGAAPAPAPSTAPASRAASAAVRDSVNADDLRRSLVAYYQRVEWTYTEGRCAVTDRGRTTRFQCGRIRVGTQPDADVTAAVRAVRGRTVDLHPGDAPWRRVVVPAETERAAILSLLANPRVRWAGLDFQAAAQRPARRAPPRRSGARG